MPGKAWEFNSLWRWKVTKPVRARREGSAVVPPTYNVALPSTQRKIAQWLTLKAGLVLCQKRKEVHVRRGDTVFHL